MTEQRRPDDRVGDAAVDAAWRRATREQPPAALDAAILAAARDSVSRERRPAAAVDPGWRWTGWPSFAAAAGVVGLSFVLVQMLPQEDLRQTPATDDAARAPAVQSSLPDAPSPPAARAVAPAPAEPAPASPGTAGPRPSAISVPPPAALPAPASAPAAAAETAADSAASALSVERAASSSGAAGPAFETAAKSPAVSRPESAASRAGRIAALHDAGDLAAAAAELRAFRAAQPEADTYLPERLRAWAASVGDGSSP